MRGLFFGLIRKIKSAKRLSQLLVLISFLATFILVRIITNLQRVSFLPSISHIRDMHVHHLVPGIIMLLISGYVGLSFWHNRKLHVMMSVLFGMGAALTIDEFALWLYLRDVYWERQGRTSIDAVIISAILLTIAFVIAEVYDYRRNKRLSSKLKEKLKMDSFD